MRGMRLDDERPPCVRGDAPQQSRTFGARKIAQDIACVHYASRSVTASVRHIRLASIVMSRNTSNGRAMGPSNFDANASPRS